MAVVHESIEKRSHGRRVATHAWPVLERSVRSDNGGCTFVPAHNDFQEIFGCARRQLAHPEVVDDQERHVGQGVPSIARRLLIDGDNRDCCA